MQAFCFEVDIDDGVAFSEACWQLGWSLPPSRDLNQLLQQLLVVLLDLSLFHYTPINM